LFQGEYSRFRAEKCIKTLEEGTQGLSSLFFYYNEDKFVIFFG